LALGPMGSNEIALRRNLPKPVIACAVIDAKLQNFPKKDGVSGVKNLNYLDEAYSVTRTIQAFQEIAPFKKLAILINPGVLEAIPQLHERAQQEVQALNAQLEIVPVRLPLQLPCKLSLPMRMRFIFRPCSKFRQVNLICWWRASINAGCPAFLISAAPKWKKASWPRMRQPMI